MKRRDRKPKRSAVSRHRGAALKKAIGVLIATILIVGTVIGAVGKDNLFTMRAEAGTTHPIVAYIGRSDMTDEEREGNVHIDLDTFGDTFTYDIMAYVTENAEAVIFSAETLLDSYVHLRDNLKQYIGILHSANDRFFETYNALTVKKKEEREAVFSGTSFIQDSTPSSKVQS